MCLHPLVGYTENCFTQQQLFTSFAGTSHILSFAIFDTLVVTVFSLFNMMAGSKLHFWDGLLSVITPELYKKLIVAQSFFEGAFVGVRQNHARTVTAQAN